MPTNLQSLLDDTPGNLHHYQQFVDVAARAEREEKESFVVAWKERLAAVVRLPDGADTRQALVDAAKSSTEVRAAVERAYVKFLDSIARLRNTHDREVAANVLAQDRKRGVPLSSRRIIEVAKRIDIGVRGRHSLADTRVKPPGAGASVAQPTVTTQAHQTSMSPDTAATGPAATSRARESGKSSNPASAAEEGPRSGNRKKKRRSRPQTALHTLRTEGVAAFRSYIAAGIGEPEVLRVLLERIYHEDMPEEFRHAALTSVQARLALAGPEAGQTPAPAIPAPQAQEPEFAAIPATRELSTRETNLFGACAHGRNRVFNQLLKQGKPDFNIGAPLTMLAVAADRGHATIVSKLLRQPGIDVNLGNEHGATPLYLATQWGHLEVVKQLAKDPRTNVNLAVEDGTTPLHCAAQNGQAEAVDVLLSAPGCRADAKNLAGATPLGMAAQWGHHYIVDRLLAKGANANATGPRGLTPLHLASIRWRTAIVEALLNAGADLDATAIDPDQPNSPTYTPYDLAKLAGAADIMRLMQRHRQTRAAHTAQATPTAPLQPDDRPAQPPARNTREPGTPPNRVTPDARQRPSEQRLSTSTANPDLSPDKTGGVPGNRSAAGTGATLPVHPPSGASPLPSSASGEPNPPAQPNALTGAKQALREQVHELFEHGNLDDKEGIGLLVGVNQAKSHEDLCRLHNQLAHIERVNERSRRGTRRTSASGGRAGLQQQPVDRHFALGQQTRLKADQVERQIRRHLPERYRVFVSQAVNDMEFGRGKRTPGHPGLWHASAGIAGVGSCSIFYYHDSQRQSLRIVGIGHHLTRSSYQLDYATEELGGSGGVLTLA